MRASRGPLSPFRGRYSPVQHDLRPSHINALQWSPGLMPKHSASKSGKNLHRHFFSVSDKDRFEASQARDPIRLQRPLWISSVRREIERVNERNATSDCGHAPSSPPGGKWQGIDDDGVPTWGSLPRSGAACGFVCNFSEVSQFVWDYMSG